MTRIPEPLIQQAEEAARGSETSLAVPNWVRLLLILGTRHWLAILTSLTVFYVGLSFLAPVAMHAGRENLAHKIYHLYSFTCHQLPASSFWLLGAESSFRTGLEGIPDLSGNFLSKGFVGTIDLGFKSGMCWRTFAIYASLAILLLHYMGTGRKWKALPIWFGLLFALPMAVDGLSQMIDLRESNLFLRLLTGGLFSLGLTWALVPRVDTAMGELLTGLQCQK